MEVKVSILKSVSSLGEKLARITIVNSGDFTPKVFKDFEGFVLREIEEDKGRLEVSQEVYYDSTVVAVSGDTDIEEMLKSIVDLYRRLCKTAWEGQKDYTFSIP